jgi:hypothetical protein
MGYNFKIGPHYKVKVGKHYPWPYPGMPKRMFEVFDDDILTADDNGIQDSYTSHLGVCVTGIIIPKEDLNFVDHDVNLVML